MALFTSRTYSLCPRVEKQDDRLRAVTGWRLWLMSFGLCNREVLIDPRRKTIEVRDWILWFFPWTRKTTFKRVRAVTYGYTDAASFDGWNFAHDAYDVFKIGLRLHGKGGNDEHWHLFRFQGDGSFVNDGPFPDWMYWPEYVLDAKGTQQSESRCFVELLARMTGAEITPP